MTARGIDVSRWQGAVDWSAVRAAGIEFAYVNCSNQEPDVHYRGARAAGLAAGLYYRAAPTGDPYVPALALAGHVARLDAAGPGRLPPCLDVEDDGPNPAAWTRDCLRYVRAILGQRGRRLTLYSGAWYLRHRLDGASWADTDTLLWVADYGAAPGAPGADERVAIHQHSNTGRVPGVLGDVDLNVATWPLDRITDTKEAPMPQVALVERVIARLRAAGITVHEVPGWRTRARPGAWNPRGLLVHHTAIRASYTRPAAGLRTCVDGREDLPGPLCQTLGAYDGAVHVISAGRANHAGQARASGPLPAGNGNELYWGHEIDYYPDAPMSPEQYRTATVLGAIVADELGGGPELVRAHAETSVTGKWDPGHALPNRTIDMAAFRRDVAAALDHDQEDPMTSEDRAYFDQRFADLWGRFGVQHNPDGTIARDRLTDLWDRIGEVQAAVAELACGCCCHKHEG